MMKIQNLALQKKRRNNKKINQRKIINNSQRANLSKLQIGGQSVLVHKTMRKSKRINRSKLKPKRVASINLTTKIIVKGKAFLHKKLY